MTKDFALYKKLAGDVEEKLSAVLDIANEQLAVVEREDLDRLTQITDQRGKLIDESNLIAQEMDNLYSLLDKSDELVNFKSAHTETVLRLKNDIHEVNGRVVDGISKLMDECRRNIKSTAENKEIVRSYGYHDYPAESTYFDKRN